MRSVMTVAVSMLGLMLACQTQAASKQDWDECAGTELAVAIRACSRIVSDQASSPSDRADGYSYRAGAYLSQRNFDQAIADYSEAIRLVPRNVSAFTGRALAYFHTGNRDQAAADFSVVQHLDPSKAAALAESDPELKQIAALASGRSPRSIDADASGRHLPREGCQISRNKSIVRQRPACVGKSAKHRFSLPERIRWAERTPQVVYDWQNSIQPQTAGRWIGQIRNHQ